MYVLVGRLKVPYQDISILTNAEIDALIYGHEVDIKERFEFERDMAGISVSPYAPKSWDIRKNYRFGWEAPIVPYHASKEEIIEMKKIVELVRAKRKKNGESSNRS